MTFLDHHLRAQQNTSFVMTAQLQQAIKLLQLNHQELHTFIQGEMEANPFLMSPDEDDSAPPASEADFLGAGTYAPSATGERKSGLPETDFLSTIPAKSQTLREHLLGQINTHISAPTDRFIATYLVNFIQPTGYFEGSLEEIGANLQTPLASVERVLKQMQRFEPSGVCARHLAECLRLQLEDQKLLTPALEIFLANLPLVAKGETALLGRKCQTSPEGVGRMLDLIRHLSPKPGLAFSYEPSPAVIPEVLMVWDPATAGWAVDLNPETTPKILLNTSFYTRIKETTADAQVRHYLAEQMNHANWLLKALHQRATTLIRTAKEIIACQELFFQKGVSFMRPLVLRDIASAINMHESTISRVTSNKYIATPRGIFELKYFFNSSLENAHGEAVSSESVRHRLRALIDEESPHAPLSDESLALKLQAEGTDIARRTIAKYREMMGIAPAFQRRRSRHLRKPAPSLA